MLLHKYLLPLVGALVTPSALGGIIISGDGTEQCQMASGPGGCSVQSISVHGLWQPNNPDGLDAQWVSYADTGHLGSTLATPLADGDPTTPDYQNPLMLVREVLVDIAVGARLVLDVWADDTADVQIRVDDGNGFSGGFLTSLLAADFSQDTCAAGPGGCEVGDRAHLEYIFTEQDVLATAGRQIFLHFATYQVGRGVTNASNPFGLLYSGWMDPVQNARAAAVPEPSSLGLMAGAGLLALGIRRRRRAR